MKPDVHSHVDSASRTAVITTSFVATAEVVWSLFADPIKLGRWWGPPGMLMTVDRHDLRPGGTVELTVSTENGDVRGRWAIHDVAAPHQLSFTFSSDGLDPTEIAVDIENAGDGSTALTITARFTSDRTMRHALDIRFVDSLVRSCVASHDVIATW